MDAALALVDTTELQQAVSPIMASAQALTITNVAEHEAAQGLYAAIVGRIKEVKEKFADPKKKAHEAHKAIVAFENETLALYEPARILVDGKLTAYEKEQKRLAEAEQRRLQAIADKEAADRLMAEALAAENAGDAEAANEIINEAPAAPVVYVPPAVAKVAGQSTATLKRTNLLDGKKGDLIKWVAEHPEWESLLDVNQAALNRMPFAIKGVTERVEVESRRVRG